MAVQVAALFVDPNGVYSGLPHVRIWAQVHDARTYPGPWPVVAHPPCQRWGRFWHGSPVKPHVYQLGDDGGCFAAALAAVRRWGGVLEHPAHSHAWHKHGLPWPPAEGWHRDIDGGWCCYVEQGWYGHVGRKPTWLYGVGIDPAPLHWGRGPQRLDPDQVLRDGYEKARRCGIVALAGGKRKTEIRNATPLAFRDVLLALAGSAKECGGREAPASAAFGNAKARLVYQMSSSSAATDTASGVSSGTDSRSTARSAWRASRGK